MPAVQHMKWYGWGVEGVSFHHEDKPALRPFVQEIIDLDLNTPPGRQTQLSDLDIPAPLIGADLLNLRRFERLAAGVISSAMSLFASCVSTRLIMRSASKVRIIPSASAITPSIENGCPGFRRG